MPSRLYTRLLPLVERHPAHWLPTIRRPRRSPDDGAAVPVAPQPTPQGGNGGAAAIVD